MNYKTLNIVGAGRLGKTIGYLLVHRAGVNITGIANRSIATAKVAQTFIGQGVAVSTIDELPSADMYLLSVTDEMIEPVCQQLATSHNLNNKLVFHCSGSLSANSLQTAKQQCAVIASWHPLQSFANPAKLIQTFPRTYCVVDGDDVACEFLIKLFNQIGAITTKINGQHKLIYHAGAVMACGHITGLIEVASRCLELSGIEKHMALKYIEPLVKGTVNNIMTNGTKRSLTGPVARDDDNIISKEIAALDVHNKQWAEIYKLLADVTRELYHEAETVE